MLLNPFGDKHDALDDFERFVEAHRQAPYELRRRSATPGESVVLSYPDLSREADRGVWHVVGYDAGPGETIWLEVRWL